LESSRDFRPDCSWVSQHQMKMGIICSFLQALDMMLEAAILNNNAI
jgi:hypothetical protein